MNTSFLDHSLLDTLNSEQKEAVSAPLGHILVLAGAGSGKTRVLVHRMAWLISAEASSPYSIMAVTFTNKAAAEMRARIAAIISVPTQNMWIGTFHGLAHRFLRSHWKEAELPQDFQILDDGDQLRLVRRVQKSLHMDENRWPTRQLQWFINHNKDKGLRPGSIEDNGDPSQRHMVRFYSAYEQVCRTSGAVDFAELLLRSWDTLKGNPALLAHYRERFHHILVDEFQDTNQIQYAWLRLLAGDSGHIFAVGDDDQSIYAWRGARMENIQRFPKEYKETRIVRLEQNYRSSSTILSAANALISQNNNRMGKTLWSNNSIGEKISLYAAFNEIDEAQYMAAEIKKLHQQGSPHADIAVLYRSNAQSRVLEDVLLQENIPYRIHGGQRFFERAEIKDALAYLRLCIHHDDDLAFERVVNVPTRGIGQRSLDLIRQKAAAESVSLWQAACLLCREERSRSTAAIERFLALIEKINAMVMPLMLEQQVNSVVQASQLVEHYRRETKEQLENRLENLKELEAAARQFRLATPGDDNTSVSQAFLAHVALESGEAQAIAGEDAVTLMTLHAAKGLEFPMVFLVGLEEGLFPHQRSLHTEAALEEERRLCYVGLTRAEQRLWLSYAELRRLYGKETIGMPSRFLREIPPELVEAVRPRFHVRAPVAPQAQESRKVAEYRKPQNNAANPFSVGKKVRHPHFGTGVVLAQLGEQDHLKLQVRFQAGVKWIMPSRIPVTPDPKVGE